MLLDHTCLNCTFVFVCCRLTVSSWFSLVWIHVVQLFVLNIIINHMVIIYIHLICCQEIWTNSPYLRLFYDAVYLYFPHSLWIVIKCFCLLLLNQNGDVLLSVHWYPLFLATHCAELGLLATHWAVLGLLVMHWAVLGLLTMHWAVLGLSMMHWAVLGLLATPFLATHWAVLGLLATHWAVLGLLVMHWAILGALGSTGAVSTGQACRHLAQHRLL